MKNIDYLKEAEHRLSRNLTINNLLKDRNFYLTLRMLLERDRLGFNQLSKIEVLPILNEIIEKINTNWWTDIELINGELKVLLDSAMQLKLRGLTSEDEINPILHTIFIMHAISATNSKHFDLARMNIALAAYYGNMHTVSLLTEHMGLKIKMYAGTLDFFAEELVFELHSLKKQIEEMESIVETNGALRKIFAEKLCLLALHDKKLGIQEQIEVAQRALKWDASFERKSVMAILLSRIALYIYYRNCHKYEIGHPLQLSQFQEVSNMFEEALTYAKPQKVVKNYEEFARQLLSLDEPCYDKIIAKFEIHCFEDEKRLKFLPQWHLRNERYEKALYYTLKNQHEASIEGVNNINALIKIGYGERFYLGLLESRKMIILNAEVKVDTDIVFSLLEHTNYSYSLKLEYSNDKILKHVCTQLSTSKNLSALHIKCEMRRGPLQQIGKALINNTSLSILSFSDVKNLSPNEWQDFASGIEKNGVTMIFNTSKGQEYHSQIVDDILAHISLYQHGKAIRYNNRAILNAMLTLDTHSLCTLLYRSYNTVSRTGEVNAIKPTEAGALQLQMKYSEDFMLSCTRVFIAQNYIPYALPEDVIKKIVTFLEPRDLIAFASNAQF